MSLGVLIHARGMQILYTSLLIRVGPYCIFQLKLRTVYKHSGTRNCTTKVEKYNTIIYKNIKTLV